MARDASSREGPGPLFDPTRVMLIGLALSAAGFAVGLIPGWWAGLARILLVVPGVLCSGSALAAYLPHARWNFDERLVTGAYWFGAAGSAFLAELALTRDADSVAFFLRLMALGCVAGAFLTIMPTGPRLAVLSLLIVLHFGAILAAVTVPPAPTPPGGIPPWYSSQPEVRFGGSPPWISGQIWTRYARPYLQLLQMNNAYHFYAPEPGPCALLWFRVAFADGASVWVRMPDHPACRSELERRRWGALATSVGQGGGPAPMTPERVEQREKAAMRYKPPIPPLREMPLASQYREPGTQAKLLLASFARYMARTVVHPEGKDSPVTGIKIYKVDFFYPPIEHFQAGRPPLDPTLYQAFYQGEFTPKGELKDSCKDDLLYWLIPIVRETPQQQQPGLPGAPPGVPEVPPAIPQEPGPWNSQGKVVNFVRIHAGDPDEESVP